jgi:hypothetical protein
MPDALTMSEAFAGAEAWAFEAGTMELKALREARAQKNLLLDLVRQDRARFAIATKKALEAIETTEKGAA